LDCGCNGASAGPCGCEGKAADPAFEQMVQTITDQVMAAMSASSRN
jgi:hypothetical protein